MAPAQSREVEALKSLKYDYYGTVMNRECLFSEAEKVLVYVDTEGKIQRFGGKG